jgi:BirA family biotin operon repressor/biotin-[acetyl-CoA-carboxylase] ligase
LIETVASIGSTNAALVARLASGERIAEGHWLIADRQSAGKGRQGRAWFDGAGNFMGSTVVHAHRGDPPLHSLALVAGLALHEVASGHIAPPARAMLKWPNDVLVGPAKLAGILLERSGESVVIGIGVNLATAPDLPDRDTLALSAFGPAPDRDHFAEQLAAVFGQDLQRWRTYGLGPTITRWSAAAHPPGTPLVVGEPGEVPLRGRFAGLDDDGALLLRLSDGTTRTIHAGEVRLGAAD